MSNPDSSHSILLPDPHRGESRTTSGLSVQQHSLVRVDGYGTGIRTQNDDISTRKGVLVANESNASDGHLQILRPEYRGTGERNESHAPDRHLMHFMADALGYFETTFRVAGLDADLITELSLEMEAIKKQLAKVDAPTLKMLFSPLPYIREAAVESLLARGLDRQAINDVIVNHERSIPLDAVKLKFAAQRRDHEQLPSALFTALEMSITQLLTPDLLKPATQSEAVFAQLFDYLLVIVEAYQYRYEQYRLVSGQLLDAIANQIEPLINQQTFSKRSLSKLYDFLSHFTINSADARRQIIHLMKSSKTTSHPLFAALDWQEHPTEDTTRLPLVGIDMEGIPMAFTDVKEPDGFKLGFDGGFGTPLELRKLKAQLRYGNQYRSQLFDMWYWARMSRLRGISVHIHLDDSSGKSLFRFKRILGNSHDSVRQQSGDVSGEHTVELRFNLSSYPMPGTKTARLNVPFQSDQFHIEPLISALLQIQHASDEELHGVLRGILQEGEIANIQKERFKRLDAREAAVEIPSHDSEMDAQASEKSRYATQNEELLSAVRRRNVREVKRIIEQYSEHYFVSPEVLVAAVEKRLPDDIMGLLVWQTNTSQLKLSYARQIYDLLRIDKTTLFERIRQIFSQRKMNASSEHQLRQRFIMDQVLSELGRNLSSFDELNEIIKMFNPDEREWFASSVLGKFRVSLSDAEWLELVKKYPINNLARNCFKAESPINLAPEIVAAFLQLDTYSNGQKHEILNQYRMSSLRRYSFDEFRPYLRRWVLSDQLTAISRLITVGTLDLNEFRQLIDTYGYSKVAVLSRALTDGIVNQQVLEQCQGTDEEFSDIHGAIVGKLGENALSWQFTLQHLGDDAGYFANTFIERTDRAELTKKSLYDLITNYPRFDQELITLVCKLDDQVLTYSEFIQLANAHDVSLNAQIYLLRCVGDEPDRVFQFVRETIQLALRSRINFFDFSTALSFLIIKGNVKLDKETLVSILKFLRAEDDSAEKIIASSPAITLNVDDIKALLDAEANSASISAAINRLPPHTLGVEWLIDHSGRLINEGCVDVAMEKVEIPQNMSEIGKLLNTFGLDRVHKHLLAKVKNTAEVVAYIGFRYRQDYSLESLVTASWTRLCVSESDNNRCGGHFTSLKQLFSKPIITSQRNQSISRRS